MSELQHLPAPRSTPLAARAELGDALAELRGQSEHRVPRKAAVTAGVATAAVLTMGAGAAYLRSAPAPDKSLVHCYTSAGTSHDALGTDTNYPSGTTDPVATCAALWRMGYLRAGLPQAQPAQPDSAVPLVVPALVACTLHGVAAVFPGGAGTCQQLGLPAFVPDAPPTTGPLPARS